MALKELDSNHLMKFCLIVPNGALIACGSTGSVSTPQSVLARRYLATTKMPKMLQPILIQHVFVKGGERAGLRSLAEVWFNRAKWPFDRMCFKKFDFHGLENLHPDTSQRKTSPECCRAWAPKAPSDAVLNLHPTTSHSSSSPECLRACAVNNRLR